MSIQRIAHRVEKDGILATEHSHREPTCQDFFSIGELARRWRCSRGTVYNRLRFSGAKVLDFSTAGRKSKKLVPALTVSQLEAKFTKALS